jgi:hypothetical protein
MFGKKSSISESGVGARDPAKSESGMNERGRKLGGKYSQAGVSEASKMVYREKSILGSGSEAEYSETVRSEVKPPPADFSEENRTRTEARNNMPRQARSGDNRRSTSLSKSSSRGNHTRSSSPSKQSERDEDNRNTRHDNEHESPTKKTKRSRNQEKELYSPEMSEVRLTPKVEARLGARQFDARENMDDRASYFSADINPNTLGARHQPLYHNYEPEKSPQHNYEPEKSPQNNNFFTLGARPLQATDQTQYKERRAGLYDVFAPPGPIGIVIDTTKDGPSVHSIKSTSPMLGLINPGDLIIALDGEDAYGMTAATLTRTMAKKSRQKERQITLVAMENY